MQSVGIATSRALVGAPRWRRFARWRRPCFRASGILDFSLNQVPDSYRFALPLPVRLVNTILTKTSGDT
jgi:hypothetical protein